MSAQSAPHPSTSSSFIKFTSISGCRQDQGPVCYVLEIDQAKILLDCGSGPSLEVDHLQALKRKFHRFDAILVSHANLRHLGGLPHVYGSLGYSSCPVLTTVPVHHLGLVALYDAYQSYTLTHGSAPPEEQTSLDHIDRAFEHMTMLRYAQPFYLSNSEIVISALPSGHTVGGIIWKIVKGNGAETIVYAPAFNHKRECHLDGAPFELVSRPTLLITSPEQALKVAVPRKNRDEALLEAIMNAIKAQGNVLIPVETAGRTLELVQLLNIHWNTASVANVSLVLLSNQSKRMLDLAKGMLEWMGQSMMKAFENDRSNPFEVAHFKLCHSLEELQAIKEPKVVLASLESLDIGFSRSLFTSWASQSKSLLLFLREPVPGSLAHRIVSSSSGIVKVTLKIFERVPLSAEELEAYRRAEEEEKERRAAEKAFAELKRRRQAEEEHEVMVDFMDQDEDEGDTNVTMTSLEPEINLIDSAKALREIYWTDYRLDWYIDFNLPAYKAYLNSADSPTFPLIDFRRIGVITGARYHAFPYQEQHQKSDNYGESVDPANFVNKLDSINAATIINDDDGKRTGAKSSTAIPVIPTKLIDYSKEISVRCGRKIIDFSGLTDGKSLKTIINQIDPRRLILVGGPSDATDYLHNHFLFTMSGTDFQQSEESGFECFAPYPNETVRVSIASNTQQAMLSEHVIDQLELTSFKDLELAFIRAQVRYRSTEEGQADMEVDEGEGVNDSIMVLEPLTEGQIKRRDPLMVGDPKLSELRNLITQSLQIPAEFVSGDLICGTEGRLVRLRKESDLLHLEGAPSDDYYRIRDLIYSQVAIV